MQRLTPRQLLVCAVAAVGFAFDLFEITIPALVLRPAIIALGDLKPGTPAFNLWAGVLLYLPLACGGVFGFLGGYLTDRLGRRRVLVWSILIYGVSAAATAYASTLTAFLVFRCTTVVGVCVEYVAGVTWVAELFSDPRQRELALGYTQAAFGLGGLLATGAYYLAVTYGDQLPVLHGGHEGWRYALLAGLIPAIPLLVIRPFLPESPLWLEKQAGGGGALARPRVRELFAPGLRSTTVVSTLLVAGTYALASGVILNTPRMVPGLQQVRSLLPRQIEQAVSGVQLFQEFGTIAGRLVFALVVVRIATERRLLRSLLGPALAVFAWTYFFAATGSLALLKIGVFFSGLFMNAAFSFWGNYMPRVYPTHLRGTGESVALNIGARVLGATAAMVTTQLADVMPGAGASARLAHSAGTVAVVALAASLIGTRWLHEPERAQLPD